MPLSKGDKLDPYEILSLIGAGGMGEVYKARDTRLDRTVAVKVVNTEFSQRFEREARAVAALNHPNICQLYDVGPNYLVMELVEGSRITAPDSPRKLLDLAVQIADGMAAAHAAGIVHRDMKPDNILLMNSHSAQPGRVKVLDFGLARQSRMREDVLDVTRTLAITDPGSAVGTIAYMSPEQARGEQNLTPQSDQFSFGLVLYELAAGKRAFFRKSAAETMTAIIREDAEPLPASVPPQFVWIVERLLSKDPAERYDSSRDLYRELRQLRDRLSESSAAALDRAAPANAKLRRAPALLAAVAVLATAAIITDIGMRWHGAERAEDRPLFRLNVDLSPDAYNAERQNLAISPDGTRIAFESGDGGSHRISMLSLNESKATPLPGTENGDTPFFSPDGQWLGYSAHGKLMKISVHGGPAIIVCESLSAITGATWGPNGIIVMGSATQVGLSMAPDSGGAAQQLTKPAPPEATHRWPQFLPGGEQVLFTSNTILDDFDNASLRVVSVKTGKTKTILQGAYFGRYLPSGHLIYFRDGVMYGVRFDPAALETRGTAKPLLEDVSVSTAWGTGDLAFSQNGVFIYRRPVATSWPLVAMDSSGKTQPLLQTAKPYYTPRLSPDGKRLAVAEGGISRGNIFIYDLERNKVTQLTVDGQGNFGPVWAPDGKHLVYRSHYAATGEFALQWTLADGSSTAQRLLISKSPLLPYSMSPDGHRVAYVQGEGGYDIWTLPLDTGDPEHPKAGEPEPFAKTPFNELEPVFSPDGHWIAYASNEAHKGRTIFVRPFPPPKNAPDRKWTVSTTGGGLPMWSQSRRELFYVESRNDTILQIPYSIVGDTFVAEAPRVWSPQSIFKTELYSCLDLFPNGDRFVVIPKPDSRDTRDVMTRLSVLQNFFDEVRRQIPESGR